MSKERHIESSCTLPPTGPRDLPHLGAEVVDLGKAGGVGELAVDLILVAELGASAQECG